MTSPYLEKPLRSRAEAFTAIYHRKYGDRICIGGYLYELTYSEMGPTDSRQNTGDRCPACEALTEEAGR